ncbi:HAAAP family serine/threonine permease, partial [Vibrio diabolicus]
LSEKRVDRISVAVLFFSIWAAAIMNPSILGMMEALSGPVIAMILFIMPMLAVYKIDALKQYRGNGSTYFVLTAGIVAVSALIFSFFS